jgi:transporter family-2 protein
VANRTLSGVAAAMREPTWLWIPGGLLGVAVLATLTLAPPRLGTFGTFALLIAGQLAASVLIDTLGWFGMDRVPLSVTRLAGLALLASGAALVLRR